MITRQVYPSGYFGAIASMLSPVGQDGVLPKEKRALGVDRRRRWRHPRLERPALLRRPDRLAVHPGRGQRRAGAGSPSCGLRPALFAACAAAPHGGDRRAVLSGLIFHKAAARVVRRPAKSALVGRRFCDWMQCGNAKRESSSDLRRLSVMKRGVFYRFNVKASSAARLYHAASGGPQA